MAKGSRGVSSGQVGLHKQNLPGGPQQELQTGSPRTQHQQLQGTGAGGSGQDPSHAHNLLRKVAGVVWGATAISGTLGPAAQQPGSAGQPPAHARFGQLPLLQEQIPQPQQQQEQGGMDAGGDGHVASELAELRGQVSAMREGMARMEALLASLLAVRPGPQGVGHAEVLAAGAVPQFMPRPPPQQQQPQ